MAGPQMHAQYLQPSTELHHCNACSDNVLWWWQKADSCICWICLSTTNWNKY